MNCGCFSLSFPSSWRRLQLACALASGLDFVCRSFFHWKATLKRYLRSQATSCLLVLWKYVVRSQTGGQASFPRRSTLKMSLLVAVRLATRRLPSCGERRAGLACLTTSFPCSLLLKLPSSPHPGDTGRVCFASWDDCHHSPPITFRRAETWTRPLPRMWPADWVYSKDGRGPNTGKRL